MVFRSGYAAEGRRDLRIDWLRGLAMTCVIVNHSRMSSLLSWFSYERFWVVTAAEVFVALSGNPEFSDMAMQFVHACSTSPLREQLTSPPGLEAAMKLGLADESNLTPEVLAEVIMPFATDAERRSLADAGIGLQPEGFEEMARRCHSSTCPSASVYGEQDRILPDVAETMARVKRDCPRQRSRRYPTAGTSSRRRHPTRSGASSRSSSPRPARSLSCA